MEGDSGSERSGSKKPSESSISPSPSSLGERLARWKSRHNHLSDGHRNASSKRGKYEISERRKKWKYWKKNRKERGRRERRRQWQRERKAEDSDHKESCPSDRDDKDEGISEPETRNPESVVRDIMKQFPGAAGDLKQLLEMIDCVRGAVNTSGMYDKPLVKIMRKLFRSLNHKQKDTGVYLLSSEDCAMLEFVGHVIYSLLKPTEDKPSISVFPKSIPSSPMEEECRKATDEADGVKPPMEEECRKATDEADDVQPPMEEEHRKASDEADGVQPPMEEERKKGTDGADGVQPPMEEECRKATDEADGVQSTRPNTGDDSSASSKRRKTKLEMGNDSFMGPVPLAMVAKAASSNEAERFDEVTRILGSEVDNPYDVLGVNHKMPIKNIKMWFRKLSLMVHPDKCSHPQAHEAFIKLDKAFKDLQDPETRKAIDEKIREKKEREKFMRKAADEKIRETKERKERENFMAELRARRNAAEWRQFQGESVAEEEEEEEEEGEEEEEDYDDEEEGEEVEDNGNDDEEEEDGEEEGKVEVEGVVIEEEEEEEEDEEEEGCYNYNSSNDDEAGHDYDYEGEEEEVEEEEEEEEEQQQQQQQQEEEQQQQEQEEEEEGGCSSTDDAETCYGYDYSDEAGHDYGYDDDAGCDLDDDYSCNDDYDYDSD